MNTAKVASTSPLTILMPGATTAVPAIALAHYTPVLNDRVRVDPDGTSVFIVGKLP